MTVLKYNNKDASEAVIIKSTLQSFDTRIDTIINPLDINKDYLCH